MPLKAAIICTPRRAKWTILVVLIVSFFINVSYFFKIIVTIDGKLCVAFSDKDAFSVGHSWFLTTINCFIPFTLLLVMNSIIIHALQNGVSKIKADHDTTNDNRNRQLYILAAHGSNKMFFTNNAVNFFLCCVAGSKFRKDLWNLLCKKSVTNRGMSSSGTAVSLISEI